MTQWHLHFRKKYETILLLWSHSTCGCLSLLHAGFYVWLILNNRNEHILCDFCDFLFLRRFLWIINLQEAISDRIVRKLIRVFALFRVCCLFATYCDRIPMYIVVCASNRIHSANSFKSINTLTIYLRFSRSKNSSCEYTAVRTTETLSVYWNWIIYLFNLFVNSQFVVYITQYYYIIFFCRYF